MHEMNGWHWGFGFGHWIYGVFIWIAIIALLAVVIKTLLNK